MIKPYRNRRPRRKLAWLLDHETVLLENGRQGYLSRALGRNLQVWAQSETIRELTKQGHGSAVLWRNLAIGWHPDPEARNWPVRGLGMPTPESPGDTLQALRQWRDWLHSFGAAPQGSLGGSGFSLLRATLERPLWTNTGDSPPILYTIGGRQECVNPTPAHYQIPMVHSDIRAAYAQTLGGLNYGAHWTRLDFSPRLEAKMDRHPDLPIFIRAKVSVPDMSDRFPNLQEGRRGPLVARPRKQPNLTEMLFWTIDDLYPTGRDIQGCWTWEELKTAMQAGCRIRKVFGVWLQAGAGKPFLPWLEAVWRGREMRGFAGQLAKATGNATWGQFAIAKGRRKIVTASGEKLAPLRGGNPSQRAFDLAECISGRVRAQLYAGMLDAGPDFITAHTDGLWSAGHPVQGWRHTDDADELRIYNAQGYSYRTKGQPWQYVVAGMLDPPAYFEQTWAADLERGAPTLAEWETGRLDRARQESVKLITPERTLAISPATCYSGLMTHTNRERG